MATKTSERSRLGEHGARVLPSVTVDSYNITLEDEQGFVGDRASKSAFTAILDKWRDQLKEVGDDPLGDKPSEDVSKKKLDQLLIEGKPASVAMVISAIEEYAQELASVTRRFMRTKGWRDTQGVVIGGGFRGSRLGEIVVARASLILAAKDIELEFRLITHDPDHAGLIGALHLMPSWALEARDGILAIDIGGTNMRVGIVESNLKKAPDLSKASVWESDLWRHGEEDVKREHAVEWLVDTLKGLIAKAEKEKLRLAPVIGIGCPGSITAEGAIEGGAQNLPGNWESSRFNLPASLMEAIPEIGEHETLVIMHNDAVVQGLSALPMMQDFDRWAVLTIGTGLGNARFSMRAKPDTPAKKAK